MGRTRRGAQLNRYPVIRVSTALQQLAKLVRSQPRYFRNIAHRVSVDDSVSRHLYHYRTIGQRNMLALPQYPETTFLQHPHRILLTDAG